MQVLVAADPNTVLIHRCDPTHTTVGSLWKTIDIQLNSTNVYQLIGIFFFFFFNAVNLQKHNRKNIISRYGWQTQGPPAGSTKRPEGGSYSGGVFYEGSIIGDR